MVLRAYSASSHDLNLKFILRLQRSFRSIIVQQHLLMEGVPDKEQRKIMTYEARLVSAYINAH